MAPRSEDVAIDGLNKDSAMQAAEKASLRKKALDISNIRKALPEKVFQRSLVKSIFYMFADFAVWGGLIALMHALRGSDLWPSMPFWQQAAASTVFWLVTGFYMWTVFMIGHDCGHGSFSEYPWLNALAGHITHGSLLVPYFPWALSHHRHHLYHNHVTKDYSHPWYTPEKLALPESGMARMVQSDTMLGYVSRLVFPVIGWHLYLLGYPDGNHYLPTNERLWIENTPVSESYKCLFSTAVVVAFAVAFFVASGSWPAFAFYYLGPYCVFAWWIVTVTYLQHHTPGTVVYDNNTWNFVTAAFETVDRRFGYGIDDLHHNITDGHVVHHLFFKHIPHYNLKEATVALRKYLDENGVGDIYKFESTLDFPYRMHSYYFKYGLTGVMVDGEGSGGATAAPPVAGASNHTANKKKSKKQQ